MRHSTNRFFVRLLVCALLPSLMFTAERCLGQLMVMRTESFDSDPGWDGHNNRIALQNTPQSITNNFGFKNSSNAGGPAGEMGGTITPAGEPAYYANILTTPLTFNDSFSASGTLKVQGGGNTLLGFFNNGTVNEWRTANSLALRLYGRGDYFLGYSEYGTSKWRAGAAGWVEEFDPNAVHNWSLSYNPDGNSGGGTMTATMDGMTTVKNLDPGHKADGATFNRFGLLNVVKSYDSPGQIYVDNLNVNGVTHNFTTNPGATFEGLRNNTTYSSRNVRPWFDFGYSATNNAQGVASGEMGGATFRGDSRLQFSGSRLAFYGDELDETLTLQQPLKASGKVSFHRGVSDSTTHIGFFHSTDSIRDSDAQAGAVPENFLGVTIEGPSAEGFNFYPTYNTDAEATGSGGNRGVNPAYIYPNGASHNWTLDYDPFANGGNGRITVTLDGNQGFYNLAPGHKNIGAHFDRFGIVTTHIDGNGQTAYFDDLTYTVGFQQSPENQIKWTADVSGDATLPGNWFPAMAPNSNELTVVLGSVITQPRVLFADSDIKMKALQFDNANSYVLAGQGSVNLEADTGNASIAVLEGNHEFQVEVNLLSDLDVMVSEGSTLAFNNGLDLNGFTLNNLGPGDLLINNRLTLDGGSINGPVLGSALGVPEPATMMSIGLALLVCTPMLRRSRRLAK